MPSTFWTRLARQSPEFDTIWFQSRTPAWPPNGATEVAPLPRLPSLSLSSGIAATLAGAKLRRVFQLTCFYSIASKPYFHRQAFYLEGTRCTTKNSVASALAASPRRSSVSTAARPSTARSTREWAAAGWFRCRNVVSVLMIDSSVNSRPAKSSGSPPTLQIKRRIPRRRVETPLRDSYRSETTVGGGSALNSASAKRLNPNTSSPSDPRNISMVCYHDARIAAHRRGSGPKTAADPAWEKLSANIAIPSPNAGAGNTLTTAG